MPYRIDLPDPPDDAFDRLVSLEAIDIDIVDGGMAAIMPDGISPSCIQQALAIRKVRVTAARGRDAGSVWTVKPRPIRIARWQIVPADAAADSRAVRMHDGPAFGTGLHPTTALCLEALDVELNPVACRSVLDVGTGSGILALAALHAGVARAVALDLDTEAVQAAAENARLNGLAHRLQLIRGGPNGLRGSWPLVLANVLAAPLMDMAPALTGRVGRGGRLILSGISASLAPEVQHVYRRLGMRPVRTEVREGWSALVLHASW